MFLRLALTSSAGEDRHGCRIEIAGQSFQEGDQLGLLLRRETERFHEVGAARPCHPPLLVLVPPCPKPRFFRRSQSPLRATWAIDRPLERPPRTAAGIRRW